MSATYWIKLYHEILEDPKMALLPDTLWRRVIELFLLAGKHNVDGDLPETKILAWELRTQPEQLAQELDAIEQTGIIEKKENGWKVKNFSKRQSPSTPAERVRNHRAQSVKRNVTEGVTKSYKKVRPEADTEADTDTDTEAEEDNAQSAKNPAASSAASQYFVNSGYATANRLLLSASQLAAIPATSTGYLDTVAQMIHTYGEPRAAAALAEACDRWKKTKKRNGPGMYSVLNFGWVEWALEELATGGKKHANDTGNKDREPSADELAIAREVLRRQTERIAAARAGA